jgi:hypothetical protein
MLPWKLNNDERKAFGRQLQYFVVWINITEQILNKADVGYEMQIIAFLMHCLFCERIGFTGKTNPHWLVFRWSRNSIFKISRNTKLVDIKF